MAPLNNTIVVDISSSIAGMYAAMLLGDFGAHVIRVEPAVQSERETPAERLFNRSKQRMRLPVYSSCTLETLAPLLGAADVLITDFDDAEGKKLGFDHGALSAKYPQLIFCSIPPFPKGSWLSGVPADESVVAAYSGIYGDQAGRGAPPVFIFLPVCSYGAAVLACCGVTLAMLTRGDLGHGQTVEVSLFQAALALQAGQAVSGSGIQAISGGKRSALGANPLFRLFQGSDANWFFLACGNNIFFNKLCIGLERLDLLDDPRWANAPWAISPEHFGDIASVLEQTFRQKPAGHWLALLEHHDIPCAPVLSPSQFLRNQQLQLSRALVPMLDPVLGPTRQLGLPIASPVLPDLIPRPAASTIVEPETMLQQLATAFPERYVGKEPSPSTHEPSLSAPGHQTPLSRRPLEGIVVLDLAMYIAGAYGASILADMGARVIKVEPLTGDPFRSIGGAYQAWNRGTESIAIDMTNRNSNEVLRRLVAKADVLIENFRPETLQKLKLDHETLSRLNPRLVYCSIRGYGTDEPLAKRPAFDPIVQALSGAMAAQGGSEKTPVFLRVAIGDYFAALLAAWAVGLGLHYRRQTGMGLQLTTSLIHASVVAQALELFDYEGKDWSERRVGQMGKTAVYRLYEGSDGWLFLGAVTVQDWQNLCRALGMQELVDDARFSTREGRHINEKALESILEARLKTRRVDDWLLDLQRNNVKCGPASRLPTDVVQDSEALAAGLSVIQEVPGLGSMYQAGVPIRFSLTPARPAGPASSLGQETDGILTEFGFSKNQILTMRRNRLVA